MSSAPSLSSPARRRLLCAVPAALGMALVARAQPRPEKSRVVIAVGRKSAIHHLPLTLAEQLDYFAAEGLEVELQEYAGAVPAQQAMLHGDADLAAGGFEHPAMLRQRGHNCLAFALLSRTPQMVFGVSAHALPAFRHLAQLKGARIGVSRSDSSTQWFARQVLTRGGITAADVVFVGVGTSQATVTAVRDGQVDALANFDPVISMLEARRDIRVVVDTRSLRGAQELYGGPMLGGCLYAPQSYVVRYPQTVQRVTNALVRTLKWLQTAGPSDIVRSVPESYMYGDRSVYLGAFEKSREALSPDGAMSEEGVATAHRLVAQYAGIVDPVRAAAPGAVYTNEFVRRAKQRYQA